MLRKRKIKAPCCSCFLRYDLCICADIPQLDLKTRLSLVVHYKELKRTTNTGRLAVSALSNSEMIIRGQTKESTNLSLILDEKYETLLFYPSDGALELNEELISQYKKPIHLIVPDGNWRQASKVHYRHTELSGVPRVALRAPQGHDQRDLIHKESKPEGMATLEAVAYALGIIESPQVGEALLRLYELKRARTLKGRGIN